MKKCLVIGEMNAHQEKMIDKLTEDGYEVVREGVDGLYKESSFDFVVVDELSVDKSWVEELESIK